MVGDFIKLVGRLVKSLTSLYIQDPCSIVDTCDNYFDIDDNYDDEVKVPNDNNNNDDDNFKLPRQLYTYPWSVTATLEFGTKRVTFET